MKKILIIESSPLGEKSSSRKVTLAMSEKYQAVYGRAEVVIRDLTLNPLPHLDPQRIGAFRSKPEGHTDNDKRAIKDSNEIVSEVLAADMIIIGVPMWNFSVPSVLKSWIDHLCRAGKTFNYSAAGPEGLVKGKKVYVAVSSGAIYTEGPMKSYDFISPYLKTVLGFMGMSDVSFAWAEGTSIPGVQDTAVQKAIDSIKIT